MVSKRCSQIGMVIAGVISMTSVFAHHSYAQFDPCIDVTIKGEVRAAEYANPHIVLEVETVDGAIYRVEWMSLQALTRSGLEPDIVAVGDHVAITGARHRDPDINVLTMLKRFDRPSDAWAWGRERSPGARSRPANCGN
jgi:hypothetical protein